LHKVRTKSKGTTVYQMYLVSLQLGIFKLVKLREHVALQPLHADICQVLVANVTLLDHMLSS